MTCTAALAIWDRAAKPVLAHRDAARVGNVASWPEFEAGLEVLRELKPVLLASVTTQTEGLHRIAAEFIELERDFFTLTPPVPWPESEPGDQAVS